MKRAILVLAAALLAAGSATAALASAVDIIMDNPEAVLVPSWSTGTTASGRYGADYYYCNVTVSNGKTATYTPFITVTASDWQVYTWYPSGTNRTTAAQFIIHSATGDDIKYINQTGNGGYWLYLGTYTMNAGTDNYVRITNYGSDGKVVIADAVRFYSPTGENDTTPPVISAVSATPRYDSTAIRWTTDEPATSQVEYGLTTSYGGETTKDTRLITSHLVHISGLLPASTYHYRVKSEDGSGNAAVSEDYTLATVSEQIPEFRTIWADSWGNGFLSAAEVTELVDTLKAHNYNAVIPEIRKCGDAYYDSAYEPRASNIIDPPPWDPLADLIAKAHAEGIEVHGWIVTYRIWRNDWGSAPPYHIWAQHPEWAMKDASGNILDGTNYNLDPGIPSVQDYVCKVVMDIVGNYDVDGINFDYIRYPEIEWGYNEITRQRFYNEYGYWPPTSTGDSNWGTWADYRRQQVTDLVRKCYLEIMATKPHVKLSACLTSWGGLYPSYNFTLTSTYKNVFQNYPAWAQEHIIDVLMPMDYKREFVADQQRDYRDWIDFAVANKNGRHEYNGQGSYLNSIVDSIAQMQAVRDRGADGISNYSYRSTNSEGKPNEDFFDAVKACHYPSPAPRPDMPWKSAPTTGIIFGTVTDASKPNDPIYLNWIYKATVGVSGPVTRSTLTDGTGTYGLLDLPPGTYTITCSKSGFPSRSYYNQRIAAGDVLRENFDLGTASISSPAGTACPAWALISIPLVPVNPAPPSVLSGIQIDGRLYRFNNPNQSLYLYDEWSPEAFGDMTVNDGYWLKVDSNYTINYQAYGGHAATHDIPIPAGGWAIIGCPFLTEREWEDTLVTLGTTTVPLATARDNGWMSSLGLWFDSSVQSMKELGLPDDFTPCTVLKPWHGYWVRTYTDNLTLTLR